MQQQSLSQLLRNWQIKVRVNGDFTYTTACPQLKLEFTRPTLREADEALLIAMTEIVTAEFQAQRKARDN